MVTLTWTTVGLSAFYFDILKDRLYTAPARSVRRRAAQTALYRIAAALTRAVAPLMCFTAEEVWSHLPAPHLREPSVHLATFGQAEAVCDGIPDHRFTLIENWPRLIAVRGEVLKALEAARQQKLIGGSLEAKLVLVAEGDLGQLLDDYQTQLPSLFIVSQVEIKKHSSGGLSQTELPGLKLKIEKAPGKKCSRCWNYSERVGHDARYPDVCERCSAALREIEAESGDS